MFDLTFMPLIFKQPVGQAIAERNKCITLIVTRINNGRLSIPELGNLVLASLVVQTGKFVLGSRNLLRTGGPEDGSSAIEMQHTLRQWRLSCFNKDLWGKKKRLHCVFLL